MSDSSGSRSTVERTQWPMYLMMAVVIALVGVVLAILLTETEFALAEAPTAERSLLQGQGSKQVWSNELPAITVNTIKGNVDANNAPLTNVADSDTNTSAATVGWTRRYVGAATGSSPGGTQDSIQVNNGALFTGYPDFTYNAETKTLTAGNFVGAISALSGDFNANNRAILNASAVSATQLSGQLETPLQPKITQIGAMSADLNMNSKNILGALSVAATSLSGQLQTAEQPQITKIGQLSDALEANSQNVSNVATLTATSVTAATLSGTTVNGTLVTAAQPNIASVGEQNQDMSFGNTNTIVNVKVDTNKDTSVATVGYVKTAVAGTTAAGNVEGAIQFRSSTNSLAADDDFTYNVASHLLTSGNVTVQGTAYNKSTYLYTSKVDFANATNYPFIRGAGGGTDVQNAYATYLDFHVSAGYQTRLVQNGSNGATTFASDAPENAFSLYTVNPTASRSLFYVSPDKPHTLEMNNTDLTNANALSFTNANGPDARITFKNANTTITMNAPYNDENNTFSIKEGANTLMELYDSTTKIGNNLHFAQNMVVTTDRENMHFLDYRDANMFSIGRTAISAFALGDLKALFRFDSNRFYSRMVSTEPFIIADNISIGQNLTEKFYLAGFDKAGNDGLRMFGANNKTFFTASTPSVQLSYPNANGVTNHIFEATQTATEREIQFFPDIGQPTSNTNCLAKFKSIYSNYATFGELSFQKMEMSRFQTATLGKVDCYELDVEKDMRAANVAISNNVIVTNTVTATNVQATDIAGSNSIISNTSLLLQKPYGSSGLAQAVVRFDNDTAKMEFWYDNNSIEAVAYEPTVGTLSYSYDTGNLMIFSTIQGITTLTHQSDMVRFRSNTYTEFSYVRPTGTTVDQAQVIYGEEKVNRVVVRYGPGPITTDSYGNVYIKKIDNVVYSQLTEDGGLAKESINGLLQSELRGEALSFKSTSSATGGHSFMTFKLDFDRYAYLGKPSASVNSFRIYAESCEGNPYDIDIKSVAGNSVVSATGNATLQASAECRIVSVRSTVIDSKSALYVSSVNSMYFTASEISANVNLNKITRFKNTTGSEYVYYTDNVLKARFGVVNSDDTFYTIQGGATNGLKLKNNASDSSIIIETQGIDSNVGVLLYENASTSFGRQTYQLIPNSPTSEYHTRLGNGTKYWYEVVGQNITEVSDGRMKKNIRNISGALDFINNLRPVSFEMSGEDSIGFVAQEVREAEQLASFSPCIAYKEEFKAQEKHAQCECECDDVCTEECDCLCTSMYMLRYTKLISPVVAAVQELDARNLSETTLAAARASELEARNATLEQSLAEATGRIQTLESELAGQQAVLETVLARLAALEGSS